MSILNEKYICTSNRFNRHITYDMLLQLQFCISLSTTRTFPGHFRTFPIRAFSSPGNSPPYSFPTDIHYYFRLSAATLSFIHMIEKKQDISCIITIYYHEMYVISWGRPIWAPPFGRCRLVAMPFGRCRLGAGDLGAGDLGAGDLGAVSTYEEKTMKQAIH